MRIDAATRSIVITQPGSEAMRLPLKSPRDKNPEGWREYNVKQCRKAVDAWFLGDDVDPGVKKAWAAAGWINLILG